MSRDLSDERLTDAVLASFDGAESARFRQLMQALVRHLHAFASEVQPSEEEWFAAIDFLTRTGQTSDATRQEYILLSDTLGVSMLVVGINSQKPPGATEATILGPFHADGAPQFQNGDDLANGAPGEPCFFQGRVLSIAGQPIPGAHLDIWQADEDGMYDLQYADLDATRGRGQLDADAEGRYSFWSVRPMAYAIPGDGPVGELMAAARRGLMRPSHVHFRVSAPGFENVTTHVFAEGDEYLEVDAVFGVRESLVAGFERHEPGHAADGRRVDVPFSTVTYDFVLAPSTAGAQDHA